MYPRRKFSKEERSSGRFVFHPCKMALAWRKQCLDFLFLPDPEFASCFFFPQLDKTLFLFQLSRASFFSLSLLSNPSSREDPTPTPNQVKKSFFGLSPFISRPGKKSVRENKHIVYEVHSCRITAGAWMQGRERKQI